MRGPASFFAALIVAASCGGQIGDGTDAGKDGSGDVATNGKCCPISPQPGCCMSFGGWMADKPCVSVCDGMPWPDDPGWHTSTDAHGCTIWVEPSNPASVCGSKPPPPDASTVCAPQNLGPWTPQIDPPFYAHANACSAQLIADIYAACFDGGTQNPTKCQSLMTQNASCQQCLVTPRSASEWGALISLANGVVELDIAGCIADLGDLACAQKESDLLQCESAACDQCQVTDTQSFNDYQQCIDSSDTSVCAKFVAANCALDAGTYAQCFATDFASSFKLYATLFCGP